MKKWLLLGYGVLCYAGFGATSLYLAGWLGNLGVPRSIDAPRSDSILIALLTNLALIGLFGVQHSVMARPAFKRWWTRYIPEPAERSTYVLCTNMTLAILFWQWRPVGGVIWEFQHPASVALAHVIFVLGWLTVVGSTFALNHFDLFGLRQVWLAFRGQTYQPLEFRIAGPYRLVRHPLYVGWLIVFWATPTMTIAHLLFAVGMTVYLLIAIPLEERNLADHHGHQYRQYQRRVGRLIPRWTPWAGVGSSSKPVNDRTPAAAKSLE